MQFQSKREVGRIVGAEGVAVGDPAQFRYAQIRAVLDGVKPAQHIGRRCRALRAQYAPAFQSDENIRHLCDEHDGHVKRLALRAQADAFRVIGGLARYDPGYRDRGVQNERHLKPAGTDQRREIDALRDLEGLAQGLGLVPIELCERNGSLAVAEALAHIRASHEQDRQLEITPHEVADRCRAGATVRLLDIRTREEWEAVRIDGAEFVTQEFVQGLMGAAPRDALLVFYDHSGAASLDAAAYFAGHGFTNAKYLRGGIDAWARDVEPKMPRYKLEQT